MAGALGLAILFVIMKLDYHVYQKPAVRILRALAGGRIMRFCVLPAADQNTRIAGFSCREFRFSLRRWPNSRWWCFSRTSWRSARDGSTRFIRSFLSG